jgi:hypothetical protein
MRCIGLLTCISGCSMRGFISITQRTSRANTSQTTKAGHRRCLFFNQRVHSHLVQVTCWPSRTKLSCPVASLFSASGSAEAIAMQCLGKAMSFPITKACMVVYQASQDTRAWLMFYLVGCPGLFAAQWQGSPTTHRYDIGPRPKTRNGSTRSSDQEYHNLNFFVLSFPSLRQAFGDGHNLSSESPVRGRHQANHQRHGSWFAL